MHYENKTMFGTDIMKNAVLCILKYLMYELKNTNKPMDSDTFYKLIEMFLSDMELASYVYDTNSGNIFICKNATLGLQNSVKDGNVILDEEIVSQENVKFDADISEIPFMTISEFIDTIFGQDGIPVYKKFWKPEILNEMYNDSVNSRYERILEISRLSLYGSFMGVGLLKAVCNFRYNVSYVLYGESKDVSTLTKDIRDITFMYTMFHEIMDGQIHLALKDRLYEITFTPQFLRLPEDGRCRISIRNANVNGELI